MATFGDMREAILDGEYVTRESAEGLEWVFLAEDGEIYLEDCDGDQFLWEASADDLLDDDWYIVEEWDFWYEIEEGFDY